MDRFGRLLEAVKGGFEDCKTKMLLMNRYDPKLDEKHTIERMKKYIARGWNLGISFDQVVANFQKAQVEYQRQMLATKHHRGKKTQAPIGFRVLTNARNGSVIRIYKGYVNKIGSLMKLRSVL